MSRVHSVYDIYNILNEFSEFVDEMHLVNEFQVHV